MKLSDYKADYFTAFGAGTLAKAIQLYWHKKGFPSVRAERVPIPGLDTYAVRSNLVNGLPPTTHQAVAQ